MSPMLRTVVLWAVAVGVSLYLVVQFAPRLVLPGKVSQGHASIEADCFACHRPLLGPRPARCVACHSPEEIGAAKGRSQGSGASPRPARPALTAFHREPVARDCLACHTDHGGRDPAAATARFDHSLLGSERAAACQECHAAPADALHAKITTGCGECHRTAGWRPATFAHESFFRFDRRHPADCKLCHPADTFAAYTCYGCHEHSPAKMAREHREEGIRDFEPCAVCHRSASEHEAKRRWRDLRSRGLTPSEAARAGGGTAAPGYALPPPPGGAAPMERTGGEHDDDEHEEHERD